MCTILNCTFKDNFTKFGSNISKIESQKVTCVESKISKFEINSAVFYKIINDCMMLKYGKRIQLGTS